MQPEDADSERLTFTYDENAAPDVLNSTEIKGNDFTIDKETDLGPVSSFNQPRSKHHGTSYLAPALEKTILATCHA